MPESVLYSPFDMSEAIPAGRRRFWKQILPVQKINYKGTKVNFDKDFHVDLAQSFRDEAFDQVPLVFADGDNKHNMDPKNFGGDILDMQARPNGTWALIEASEEAATAIEKNPKLGVSARIRQGLEKADGRKYKRAIEHVLLTMNPRLSLEPWQAVDLSDEDAELEVVDLTSYDYKEGKAMAKTTTKPKKKTGGAPARLDLSKLSDEQFQTLLDLAETATAEKTEEDDDLEHEELEDPTAPKRKKKSRTKITIDKDEEDSKDDADDEEDDDSTELSDRIEALEDNFTQAQIDLAASNWARDRDRMIDAGVPPFLLDLAEPLLSLPGAFTIDLSDEDEAIDASKIVRDMLAGVEGVLDMTDEIGHSIDLADTESDEAKESTALLAEWEKQYS